MFRGVNVNQKIMKIMIYSKLYKQILYKPIYSFLTVLNSKYVVKLDMFLN